jgi:hypothetical protein
VSGLRRCHIGNRYRPIVCPLAYKCFLDRNLFDLIQRNLILPPIIEFGGVGRLVIGDLLRGFEGALVLEIGGYAGRTEGMAADPGSDAGGSDAGSCDRRPAATWHCW